MGSVDISTENFSIALGEIISSLDRNIKTYIMGDFNINLLDYNASPPVENFLNSLISRNYCPVITRPSRVTPINCTLIDKIFCNRVDEIESTGVITTNISDHYPIFSRELRPSLADNASDADNALADNALADITCRQCTCRQSVNYRVFPDETLSNFRNSLYYTLWEPILNNDDANESYELFKSTLLSLFKQTNNNYLLEKDGGTKNCIYKD